MAGTDSPLPPEPLPLPNPLPNPLLHLLLLLHPTDRQRPRLHKASRTLSILNPYNLRSTSNPPNFPPTHNPTAPMIRTPTPAESVRTTLDNLHRIHISLPSLLSTSQLNNSTLPSTRCRRATVSDQLHMLPMRHYPHRLGDNSTVVPMMLPCRLRQNAGTLVAGMTLRRFKISVHRVGTSTNRLRLLRLSQTPQDRLGLHLAHRRIPARVRVHRSPLHHGQVVSMLAPLHRQHKTGCNHRCNLDLDHTVLLLCPMAFHHLSG